MCQKICSANKHPLSRARKTQAFFSVISWPCALAAVPITGGSVQTWIQLVVISISVITPGFILFRYRKSKSQSYSALEIAIDFLMTLLLVGVYISGIIILATQEISEWSYPWNYKLSRGIPQIYSNLSCILLAPLYLRSFVKGYFHRFVEPMLKARHVSYSLCPTCDRSVDATMTRDQDTTVATGQGRPSVSNYSIRGVYTDDVESQLLLAESSSGVEGKQTTGVVTNN
ncbi:uncharacterized protein N7500_010126 [Penicillium coprophilum]|uniref:uncharacterized protein n=1 Tax=Penicillium coprophilum TaxID=36646 RepID=UPI00238C7272|nr:uncharacterized protein N7500_010126 [Penicillium coprophilum]KAJ5154687.1 hypothetical protein N7500_010126 [Penicillium coprophilum]